MKLGIIIFPIFCLLLSLCVLVTDVELTTSLLENKEAVEPTKQLIKHFFFLDDMPSQFNEKEAEHMEDVAWLIRLAFIAMLACCAILYWQRKSHKHITRFGSASLIILLTLFAVTPFQTIFTYFHKIFFPQGNWQFAADSTIIQYYPFEFFMNYTIVWWAYALLIAIFLYVFSRIIR